MATMGERLDDMLRRLEQERDELRVRLHLGKAEAKEEWDKLDARIGELRARLDRAGSEAGDAADEVAAAARRLGEEIRTGFDRIRRAL